MLVVVDLPPGGFSFPGYFSMLPTLRCDFWMLTFARLFRH